eukprot:COSAG06_NODE_52939_length_303_cov_0.470588_1_plen_34_part_10
MMGFCLAVAKIVKSRWCGNVFLSCAVLIQISVII